MPKSRLRSNIIRFAAALGVALTLGGCIVVPVGGYYRHPYRYGYYY